MKSLDNKKIVIFDIDYTLFNTDIFKQSQLQQHIVYDEVLPVLTKLSQDVILGILSEGEIELQHQKLTKTEILSFFNKEHIHIVSNKHESLKDFMSKYHGKNLFVIDDKLTILHEIKKINQEVVTIWVKRGHYALDQLPIEGFEPDATVENLFEILPMILPSQSA